MTGKKNNPYYRKLRLKDNQKLLLINPPEEFARLMSSFNPGTKARKGILYDIIFLFTETKDILKKELPAAIKKLSNQGILWAGFPKKSSGISTDLNRDSCYEILQETGMQILTLISVDVNWSAFGLRAGAKPQKKENGNRKSEYIDAEKRSVIIPDDLKKVFKTNIKAYDFFETLSFTNRKEYVLWITGAKKIGTRGKRIKLTIEYLIEGKKNPHEK
jgi:hypothetical protein